MMRPAFFSLVNCCVFIGLSASIAWGAQSGSGRPGGLADNCVDAWAAEQYWLALDLCYEEDAAAEVDLNVVMTAEHEYVELQGTGEQITFGQNSLDDMLSLARNGVSELTRLQADAIKQEA